MMRATAVVFKDNICVYSRAFAANNALMIRVVLPFHLRALANITGEVKLDVDPPITIGSVLGALEERYPLLKGTIRDHGTLKRRAFLRYYACQMDLSLEPPEAPLPDAVAKGEEPFLVIGAIAGG
jgi:hypothetical protein